MRVHGHEVNQSLYEAQTTNDQVFSQYVDHLTPKSKPTLNLQIWEALALLSY